MLKTILLLASLFLFSCSESQFSSPRSRVNTFFNKGSRKASYGGEFKDVAVREDYMYLAKGVAGIEIYDFHDKKNPYYVSNLHFSESVHKVQVYKDHLYALLDQKIQLIDVSDKKNPKKTKIAEGFLSSNAKLVDFYVLSSSKIYVISNKRNFFVIDFKKMGFQNRPTVQSYTVHLPGLSGFQLYDMEVFDGDIYFAAGTAGVIRGVWQNSHKLNYQQVYSYKNEKFYDIDLIKDRMACATNRGLHYLNTKKLPFKKIDIFRTKGIATKVYLHKNGKRLYINDSEDGYSKFALNAFSSNKALWLFSDKPHDVQGFVGVSSNKNELILFGRNELSLLEDDSVRLLSVLISLENVYSPYYSSSSQRYLLSTKYKRDDGRIYEMSLRTGRIYGYTHTKSISYDVALNHEGNLFVAEDDRGLTLYKSNTDIRLYKYQTGFNSQKLLWLSPEHLVIAGWSSSNRYVIKFLNIEKPFSYYEERNLSSGDAQSIDLLSDGDYFYVALGKTLYIYEFPRFNDNEFRRSLSEVVLEKNIISIRIKGTYLYATYEDGFSIISLKDKEEPEISQTVTSNEISGIRADIYGSELFLVGREGVLIYNLFGSTSSFSKKITPPFLRGSGDILSVIVDAEDLYISHETKGFLRFNYKK